ncbi:molybdopterin cofactor-binding domain-containing protein [Nocardioides convexus]|uniref:molybdopterin cofactor-binding domain-containing protein n=1 Tax=Nocardioides convexus TaxID=2712224 RepID=UPI00241898D8|nr:molybdopterin cofactor-binding domain-containing protein [Nocardioides convexus]
MPAGTAQGIAIHKEYKGATAVVVEIDCRPETVNRKVRDAVTGPRVTRATVVVDAGVVINPEGVKAQMMGGFSDGMAQALTYSNHLVDGHFLEASLGQLGVHPAVERTAGVPLRGDGIGEP